MACELGVRDGGYSRSGPNDVTMPPAPLRNEHWRHRRAANGKRRTDLVGVGDPGVPDGLPGDLAEIDELLDDPRFFEPFRGFFDPTHGRPSIPMETYVRMMFLKYRYRLGFEPLCREVADSLA